MGEPLGTRLNKVVSHSSSWFAPNFKQKKYKLREKDAEVKK